MPRLRIPRASQVENSPDQHVGDAGRFRTGKPKTGGRLRGVANVVTTDCRKEILRGLAAYGLDGEGTDGIAGLVYAAVKADIRNAIPLLSVVTPKQLHAEVMRTNIEIKTIAELDAELERQGLPRTAEIFPLSYRSDADAEPTELELEVEQAPRNNGSLVTLNR